MAAEVGEIKVASNAKRLDISLEIARSPNPKAAGNVETGKVGTDQNPFVIFLQRRLKGKKCTKIGKMCILARVLTFPSMTRSSLR